LNFITVVNGKVGSLSGKNECYLVEIVGMEGEGMLGVPEFKLYGQTGIGPVFL
jgi:hypothetical protein